MFNRDAAAEAKRALEGAVEQYNKAQAAVQGSAVALYELRKQSSQELVTEAQALVNRITGHPQEFDRTFSEFAIEFEKFHGTEQAVEQQMRDAVIESGAGAGLGIAAGTATALMGPTAAMAIATTFGTASTGAAISSLSGAAAINAALAWLGGGTLAAGGGGMAAGNALLALAGPIGWTAAGVAAAGGLAYFAYSNSKIADEADLKTADVTEARLACEESLKVVTELIDLTQLHADGAHALLVRLRDELPSSYLHFSGEQLDAVGALVNHIRLLSILLNQTMEDFMRHKQGDAGKPNFVMLNNDGDTVGQEAEPLVQPVVVMAQAPGWLGRFFG